MSDEDLTLFDAIPEPEPDSEDAHPLRYRWDGETLDYSDALLVRGRAYGSYVNTSRALPDVRDGLKPVQRRIIVAMDDLGIRADRRYSKSARTVGHVIGTYHPHGDTAVYDAMVRMAQPWQSNVPLVDGQGNWGNLNNEAPAAAQRYTESRLSAATSEWLTDLRPEIVDYEANFDESTQMPSVLPVTFPNLLVNGSMGVGWAMACSIPPHNLAEVCAAALLVIDDPDVSIDKLLGALPGPDLPGGGIIVNPGNLRAIYETGRGTVLVQGRVGQLAGAATVRITELPYQVSAKSIVEQSVTGAKEGKITEIFTAELPKNLTDANGVDVQIKVKRGGSLDGLISELISHTKLRDTLAFNFTVLDGGTPRTLSLRELLSRFIDFRTEVVTRRLAHERSVLHRRVHLLLAERAAADVIDRVVTIIRHADDDEDSKRKLMSELRYVPHGQLGARSAARAREAIDEVQAQHIIDMALKKINALNQLKLDEELAAKGARIDAIDAILASPAGVRDIVRQELKDARRRYGRPRRTLLATGVAAGPGTAPAVVSTPSSEVWIWLSTAGMALVTPRGGRLPDQALTRLLADRAALAAIAGGVSDRLVRVFSQQGMVYGVDLRDHQVGRSGPGRPFVDLAAGDAVVAAFAGSLDPPEHPYYLLVTAAGQVKRIPATALAAARPAGVTCCRVPAGDRIVAVVGHQFDDDILIAKAGGRVLRIATGASLRPVPTAAAGTIAGVKAPPGDEVVGAIAVPPSHAGLSVLSLHRSGLGLHVAAGEYPVNGRGSAGVVSVHPDRPAQSPAGPLAMLLAIGAAATPTVVFTDRGGLLPVSETDIPLLRRASTSSALLALADGEIPAGLVRYA